MAYCFRDLTIINKDPAVFLEAWDKRGLLVIMDNELIDKDKLEWLTRYEEASDTVKWVMFLDVMKERGRLGHPLPKSFESVYSNVKQLLIV